ncbi:hypothetical protein SLEP1_g8257 [Rubroshorea leprosula]|uniref:Malectin-like domain-containing protein n=1 Tax=Rubroshorea leprosula TaxID=152421 RepID=A0AAV5I725_9ROSI|nr:hypothetical protein SLEP1_g8257 [Rubroshorea leprosula]
MQIERFLLFLLLFFSILLSPAAYTRPDHFFINCGSDTNAIVSGNPNRTFIGDLIYPDSLSFTKQKTKVIINSQISDVLYQTARIFKQQSFYEFDIDTAGIYLVRLHFFNSTDVSTAVFDVSSLSTAQFSLLKNFTILRRSTKDSNSPLIDEFLLNITQGKFSVYFTPQGSSFAFINALEVFLAPEKFIPDNASTPTNKNYSGILSHALQTIYRINVGGEKVTPDNDTLWRTWIPDDGFLSNPSMAKNSTSSSARPNYQGAFTEFIAPDHVYQTAIEKNNTDTSNVTWSFNVSKNSTHFVRVHFCNIVGSSMGSIIFNLYLNGIYRREINPYEMADTLDMPFFLDFVLDSDESGAMNISIGPSENSSEKNAFLNGVEIMEITGESSIVIRLDKSKKIVLLVVGPVVGSLLVCVLAVALFIVLKKRKRTSVKTSVWSLFSGHGGRSSDCKGTDGTINVFQVPNLNLGLRIPFAEIQSATNNFDEKLLIGKGGFGNVYRGKLKNRSKVAVKRGQPRPAIISGDPQLPMEQVNLAEWGLLCHRKGLLETIVDPSIKDQINPNSLRIFAETAEKCLLEDGANRPSMDTVLWDLEYALQLQQTAVYREPHEDSNIDATSGLRLVNVQHLPSLSLQIERDDVPILRDSTTEESFLSASKVFSQLRINHAR